MANFRVEMIGSGGLGRTDQNGLHARVDDDPRFFVGVKVSSAVGSIIVAL